MIQPLAMEMVIALLLALLPGLIAEWRRHRYPLAVTVLGFACAWISMLLWIVVMFWAVVGDTKDAA